MARKRNGEQAAPAAGSAAEDTGPQADATGASGRQPVQRFRVKNVKAAVWENQARGGGTFYSVTYARSYRDEQGNWHDTNSFGEVESYLLQEVAGRAARWITERTQAAAPQSAGDEIPL